MDPSGENLVYAYVNAEGQKAEVTMNNGCIYSGVVHGINTAEGIIRLDYAVCKVSVLRASFFLCVGGDAPACWGLCALYIRR